MAETLTPQQLEAVRNRGGKLLVSAAAGSGKTKVLVDRLLRYVTDPHDPANLDDFLIITYTKAAASELRGKIAAKLTEHIALNPGNRHLQQQMQRLYLTKITTVHAFCSDLLREYAYLMDIPADFSIADESECFELQMLSVDTILEQAYHNGARNDEFQAFINSQGFGRDDRQIPEILLKVYNSAKCHLDPENWLDWCIACTDTNNVSDASQTVWGRYLIDDLKQFLSLQIQAFNNCIQSAGFAVGMDKPVTLLQSTVAQLTYLAQADSWDHVVSRKNVDFGRLTFSKSCADMELVERIKAVRNSCKKGLERKLRSFAAGNKQVLLDLQSSSAATKGLVALVRDFSREYDHRKKARRVLDFGDLEHRTLDLLMGKRRTVITVLAEEIGNRFREIMVDEYQDSNGVQDAIFTALTNKRQNCFMVGDVKQSIYQFRLADPGIFLEKYNAYVPAECAQINEGRKVLLSSNFRSSNGIIQGVNDVFSLCMSAEVGGLTYDEAEMLHEGISHIPLNEPEIELYGIDVQEDTYREEAVFTAKKIRALLDGKHMVRQGETLRPIRPEDIVILLRSPGSVGGEFAYALQELGIRCTTGNSVDLLQTEEISVLRSLLQIISNPLQDIPLIAVLTSRVFGFNANDLAIIRGKKRFGSLYEALKLCDDRKSRNFISTLSGLRHDARLYNLPQLLQRIFMRTSMDSIFSALPEGEEKINNLHNFCQMAADYEASGHKFLDQFLNHLEAMDEKGLIYSSELQNQGVVTIMSIHKSKGLEFPVVFLCGLSRSFNHESAHAQVLSDKELGLGLCCVDTKNRVRYPTIAKKAIAIKILKDSISEEMRVLYVAMTRARDRLIMSYAAKNLAGDISDIALRSDMSGKLLMTSEVTCPGEWVLQTAMHRTESGELFGLGGRPDDVRVSDLIWGVHVVKGSTENDAEARVQAEYSHLSADTVNKLKLSLSFAYPHLPSTQAPSKQTATQLKGRLKDQEAAEHTQEDPHIVHKFRKPSFIDAEKGGIARGNAVHAVMQHICFAACIDLDSIKREITRLVVEERISPEMGQLVLPEKIAALFATPLGIKLREAKNVLREFKFSILEDGSRYSADLNGEKILLQGVVDCALIEEDGITVIDFKTDVITNGDVQKILDRYSAQVNIYANALERIYEQKIIGKYLYLFDLDRFVEVL